MQALSKSDDSVRPEFIAIVNLFKNIAQLLMIELTPLSLVPKKVTDVLHPF